MIARLNRLLRLGLISTALSIATSADARQVLPIIGVHAGDHTVVAVCPPGQVMAGLSGRAGVWIDQIQLICATPLPGGSFSAAAPASDRFGGYGGGAMTSTCDNQSRLLAVRIDLTADATRVGLIEMACVAADGRQTVGYLGLRDSHSSLAFARNCSAIHCDGGAVVRSVPEQSCPQQSFVGFTVRFGADVNSIGFICDTTPMPVRLTGRPR